MIRPKKPWRFVKIFEGFEKFIIASHDAGGANVLAALVERMGIAERSVFILGGPAINIFEKTFMSITKIEVADISSYNPKDTFVLTSTSNEAELEREVLDCAHAHFFVTASLIDHWIKYPIRFVPVQLRNDGNELFLKRLPKYVLVSDDKAHSVALQSGFPIEKLVVVGNPYLEKLKSQYLVIEKKIKKHNRILYMSEYFKSPRHPNLNELDFLKDILFQIKSLLRVKSVDFEFYLRLHPSEQVDKYSSLFAEFPFLKISQPGVDLLEDLATAKVMIGKSSMGLAVSAMLGIPTFSYRHPDFEHVVFDSKIIVIDSIDKNLIELVAFVKNQD